MYAYIIYNYFFFYDWLLVKRDRKAGWRRQRMPCGVRPRWESDLGRYRAFIDSGLRHPATPTSLLIGC